jgi:hypothetical protein
VYNLTVSQSAVPKPAIEEVLFLHYRKFECTKILRASERRMFLELRSWLAYNASGLLLCWYFITISPQLKSNKITDDEVNNKCSIEIRLPILADSITKDDSCSVAPA